jgi:hypothetical protein
VDISGRYDLMVGCLSQLHFINKFSPTQKCTEYDYHFTVFNSTTKYNHNGTRKSIMVRESQTCPTNSREMLFNGNYFNKQHRVRYQVCLNLLSIESCMKNLVKEYRYFVHRIWQESEQNKIRTCVFCTTWLACSLSDATYNYRIKNCGTSFGIMKLQPRFYILHFFRIHN